MVFVSGPLFVTTIRLLELARDSRPRREALERLADLVIPALSCACSDPAASADVNSSVAEFCDAFDAAAGKAADLEARLDAMRGVGVGIGGGGGPPVAAFAALAGLFGDELYRALMALRLPAAAPASVHLEVALAAMRLDLHERLDAFLDVLESMVSQDEDSSRSSRAALFTAFVQRQLSLRSFIEAHVNLAGGGAPPPPGN